MQPIFVGDVQGCGAEFGELLSRAADRFGRDFELWLVGDLINRGPDNLSLLSRIREEVDRGRCRYVLGNHEIGLLRAAWGLRDPHPLDTFQDVLDDPDADDWVEWLRQRPLVEAGRLGEGGERPFAMVHAGVAADWNLEELSSRARAIEARLGGEDADHARSLLAADRGEDEVADDLGCLTRCRSVASNGRWSSRDPKRPEDLWHRAWASHGHDYAIVYGHFAIQGLHVAPGLRGLDTGCVHRGRLTAWIPDLRRADPFEVPDPGFWQAEARRRYYDARGPILP